MSDESSRPPIAIPVSSGIPVIAKVLLIFGVLVVIAILGIVDGTSKSGHVWPAENSAKIPLSPLKPAR